MGTLVYIPSIAASALIARLDVTLTPAIFKTLITPTARPMFHTHTTDEGGG